MLLLLRIRLGWTSGTWAYMSQFLIAGWLLLAGAACFMGYAWGKEACSSQLRTFVALQGSVFCVLAVCAFFTARESVAESLIQRGVTESTVAAYQLCNDKWGARCSTATTIVASIDFILMVVGRLVPARYRARCGLTVRLPERSNNVGCGPH